MRIRHAVVATMVVVWSASGDVTLTPGAASGRDPVWQSRPLMGVDSWGIVGNHVPGTNGNVWWSSFPGETGRYKVELGAVLEPDGDSPYKFYINNQEVRSGRFPYSTGSLDCGSDLYKLYDIDLGEHQIAQGAAIKYWASSVYPCGTSHGQYSRFYRVRFTLLSAAPDTTPPSVPAGVRVTGATNTSLTIAWDPSADLQSGISGYHVYFGAERKATVTGTQTSATVGSLTRNTLYPSISVSAVNGRQLESARSAVVSGRTTGLSAPAGTVFLRAVDGFMAGGMQVMSGVNGAVAGSAVYGTVGNTTAPLATDSRVTCILTLPSAGTWYAWGRFLFESDGSNNSYWISVDGAAPQRFGNGEHLFAAWHWEGYMNTGHVTLGTLGAGEHTVVIAAREPSEQSLLDAVCLTTASSYVPDDADVDFTDLPALRLLAPNGGEAYRSGDTIVVQWLGAQSRVPEAEIRLSLDDGDTWTTLNATGSISYTSAQWGTFRYPVPAGVNSQACRIRVVNYNSSSMYVESAGLFSIVSGSVTATLTRAPATTAHGASAQLTPAGLMVSGAAPGSLVRVLDLKGRTRSLTAADTRGAAALAIPAGVWFVRMRTPEGEERTLGPGQ